MRTENMTSNKGRAVPNQFIISDSYTRKDGALVDREVFQSYKSVIAQIEIVNASHVNIDPEVKISLDSTYWNYSVTTSKYRNQFLNETKKETQKKIDSGEYTLTDLNQ